MSSSIVYILISVLLSAIGQILLKAGMNNMGPLTLTINQLISILLQMATNFNIVIGLGIYALGTIFWLVALSRVDLSFAYPFASLSYVLMLVASWGIFDERISPMRLFGSLVVGLGVYFISRG